MKYNSQCFLSDFVTQTQFSMCLSSAIVVSHFDSNNLLFPKTFRQIMEGGAILVDQNIVKRATNSPPILL